MKTQVLYFVLLTGCSVLVDPDPGRLGGDTPPTGCADGCSDSVACTVDRCVMDACVNDRMDALCDEGFRCDAVRGCVDESCTDSAECDDRLACNGAETCTGGVCTAGAPVACDDGNACTIDACDPATGRCASTPNDGLCDDGFECTRDFCGASGCERETNDTMCDDGFCFTGARCEVGAGCIGGDARNCEDGDPCTADRCDSEAMACVNAPIDEGVCAGMTGDTCETVRPIVVTGSAVRIMGEYAEFADDYESDCRGGESRGGPDAVYSFTVPAGMDLRIEANGGGGGDPILAVSDTCGSFDYAGHGCNDDISTSNHNSRLWLHRLSGETLFLLVDRFGAGDGTFEIVVTAVPQTRDTCAREFDISGGGAVVGRIPGDATAAVEGTCQGVTDGLDREATFRFERRGGSSPARLEAWSNSFDPDLYARIECGDSRDVACRRGSSRNTSIEFSLSGSVTDYSVILDGRGVFGDGLYTLRFDPG